MITRPGEHSAETRRGGETVPRNYRVYQSVYCPTCGAVPGQWCQRVTDRAGTDLHRLRTLHPARWERMAALEEQGWH